MKAFRFTLQRLLEIKEARERVAEERLAAGLRAVRATKDHIKRLSARRQQVVTQIEAFDGRQTHRHRLSVHLRYLERLQGQIHVALQRLVEEEFVAEQRRQELCALVRERKTLEKLRDKERRDWLVAGRRLEQKQTDEFAVTGFLRQRQWEVTVEG